MFYSSTGEKKGLIVCWLSFLTRVRNSLFVPVVFKVEWLQQRGVVCLCEVMHGTCVKSLLSFPCRSGSVGQIYRGCVFTHQTHTHRKSGVKGSVKERQPEDLNALINYLNVDSKCFPKKGNNESRHRK